VPDNPRVGVTKAGKYEPVLNRTYEDLSAHFGAAVIPARPYKPRDKAKVEVAVLIASRWILPALRNRVFYSLEEMRVAVAELLEKLNDRKMRRLGKSRRELFEEIERAALRSLPVRPFEYAEWAQPRVDISYHVEHDDHFYSVHFSHIGEKLDLRATETRGGPRPACRGDDDVLEEQMMADGEREDWSLPRGRRTDLVGAPDRLTTTGCARSRREDDVPPLAARVDVPVRLDDLLERIAAIDHWPVSPGFREVREEAQVLRATSGRAGDDLLVGRHRDPGRLISDIPTNHETLCHLVGLAIQQREQKDDRTSRRIGTHI